MSAIERQMIITPFGSFQFDTYEKVSDNQLRRAGTYR